MAALLLVLSFALFGVLSSLPGDPVDMLVLSNPNVRPQDIAALKALRGLDQPWPTQWWRWLVGHAQPLTPPTAPTLAPVRTTAGAVVDVAVPVPPAWRVTSTQAMVGTHLYAGSAQPGAHAWVFAVRDANGQQDAGSVVVNACAVDAPCAPPAAEPILHVSTVDARIPDNFAPDVVFARDDVVLARGRSVRFGMRAGEPVAVVIDNGVVLHPTARVHGALYVLTGDTDALGYSQTYKRPVWELLFGGVPESATVAARILSFGRVHNTVALMLPAMLCAGLLAIVCGTVAAWRVGSRLDRAIGALSVVAVSTPPFWLGIIAVVVLAGALRWLPASGAFSPEVAPQLDAVLWDRARHSLMPTAVLTFAYLGTWLRYVRTGVVEVVHADFVRTARAKGAGPLRVVAHALKNALLPFVTVVALSCPALFSGALLTETVFAWPGVGRLQYEAIMNNDSYVAIVLFLVSAALVMIGSLAADVLYVLLDPRLRTRRAP